jgi:glucans biosynthesis protein C
MALARPDTLAIEVGDSSSLSILQQDERLHALDALRAVAMLLGLVLHAALPFMRGDVAGTIPFMRSTLALWPASDRTAGEGFALLVYLIHAFRMPAFFVMAGFFAHLLYRRRGMHAFASQRLRRIGLPLVIAVLLVIPLGYAVWTYGWNLRKAAGLSFVQSVGRPLSEVEPSPMHLWFLEYLLVLYTATILIDQVGSRITGGRFGQLTLPAARWLVGSAWAVPVLALVTLPPMLSMEEWTSDTPHSFLPQAHLIAFYGLFYLFGWLLYAHRDQLAELAGRAGWQLGLGLVVVLPLLMMVIGPAARGAVGPQRQALELLGRGGYALLAWLLTLGVIGLFLRSFDRPSPAMRYLVDAAYWMYLVHLPLVALLNIAVVDWELPGLFKMLGVFLASSALLLLSYQLVVRHTVIGRVLNGPRGK